MWQKIEAKINKSESDSLVTKNDKHEMSKNKRIRSVENFYF